MSNYNYGPPPPPPSQAGHQPYGHHPAPAPYVPSTSGTPARSGASHPRGRGGGGYMSNYNTGRPEYQPPSQQLPYPYSGYAPQTPAAYPSDGSYQTPPQWQPEHTPAPPLPSHAPAPLSSSNYHPNFAQPGYGQQQHPQQHPQQPPPPQQQQQYAGHPSYATPGQSPYPPHYAAAPPSASPQWSAPPAHQPQSSGYQGGGGRHRGGYQGDRGGSRGGAAAIRVAYREEHHQPPANPGYGASPYPDPRAAPTPYQPHPAPQQYHYAPPPAAPPLAAAPSSLPARHDAHFSHGHGNSGRRGGRGGSFRDGTSRGGRSQFQGSGDKQRHNKKSNNAQHESTNQKPEQQAHGKKKRKVHNTLGLTPGDDGSGSDEDDEGEEGKLSDLMGSEVIQVSDMAAFIAERKKRYPTKERVAAKQTAEVAQKAQKTEETLRLEREADKLRRQLKKVESSIKRKREQQDEGDEMRETSPVADSDADMPEVQSSRAPDEAATPSSEAAKKADISRHCKYYSTGGSCGKKGKCRFVHDPAVREAAIREKEANNGQLTIKQRLILNDKEQEDLTVLESIQYLREKGLMKPVSGITIKPGGGPGRPQSRTSKQPTAAAPSTLPAPPASLPLPPNRRMNGLPRTTPASGAAATLPLPPAASSSPATSTVSAAQAAAGRNLGGYGGAGINEEDLP